MGMWTIPQNSAYIEKFTTEEIDSFIETLAKAIVQKGMAVPAIVTLEMAKPISFLGFSALVSLTPVLDCIFDPSKTEKIVHVLADRTRIEELIVTIESIENGIFSIKGGTRPPSPRGVNPHGSSPAARKEWLAPRMGVGRCAPSEISRDFLEDTENADEKSGESGGD